MALSIDASKMNTLGDRILLGLKRLQALLQPAPRQLTQTLKNAESLLSYAADYGIEVDADVALRIVSANLSGKAAWNSPAAGTLIADISKLAAAVGRVTEPGYRARAPERPRPALPLYLDRRRALSAHRPAVGRIVRHHEYQQRDNGRRTKGK
jgi:hypothetical protein